jgi:3-dehydroquinate dehydratase type I
MDARGSTKVILSMHHHDGTPGASDLAGILKGCAATGADVVKIVTMATTWADNLRVLNLIPKAHDQGLEIIAFCMGSYGRISRVLSNLMGGYLTFVSLERGEESAAGQIPVQEMKKILEHFVL